MNIVVAAIHGIMTGQTRPSWPDEFDAWAYARRPGLRVLKKEYRAGPFPRLNCRLKNPLLARSLAAELELFAGRSADHHLPATWFLAHSNGAVIALLATERLIARGHWVAGLILTGAACEADIVRNKIAGWITGGKLGCALAYCSRQDKVLPSAPGSSAAALPSISECLWRAVVHPYGSLGRTGWMVEGRPLELSGVAPRFATVRTRWFEGGHSTYFSAVNLETTFNQALRDIEDHTPEQAANGALC